MHVTQRAVCSEVFSDLQSVWTSAFEELSAAAERRLCLVCLPGPALFLYLLGTLQKFSPGLVIVSSCTICPLAH